MKRKGILRMKKERGRSLMGTTDRNVWLQWLKNGRDGRYVTGMLLRKLYIYVSILVFKVRL